MVGHGSRRGVGQQQEIGGGVCVCVGSGVVCGNSSGNIGSPLFLHRYGCGAPTNHESCFDIQ
jgi:hypothetical protein